jgi:DNA-binding SARP family transcriptional activator
MGTLIAPSGSPSPVHPGTATGCTIRLGLLEGFQIEGSDGDIALPYSSQRVLALLAIHTRRSSRAWVAATLWTDCSEERASANLRSALWRINRSGNQLVAADARAVRLVPEIAVDLREISDLAHEVLRRDAVPDDVDLGDLIDVGELLPGWYDDWVITERERFRQLRLHALERLCEQLARAGCFGQAVEAGLAAVAGEPIRESAHRALISAYLAEGNRGEAIRQYESCRRILQHELLVEPSASTSALLSPVTRR